MIYLFTGVIGSGKSAQMVYEVTLGDFKDRPVFTHGIKWLREFPHVRPMYCKNPDCKRCGADPNRENGPFVIDWFKWIEPLAVLVVDEAHLVWPQRTKDEAPPSVVRMRESRSEGMDFLIATQVPMFLDVDVRRLCNFHYHVLVGQLLRKLYIFNGYRNDPNDTSGADERPFQLPKEVFDSYESAKVHTKLKRKFPFKLKLILAAIVVCSVVSAYYFWIALGEGGLGDQVQPSPAPVPVVSPEPEVEPVRLDQGNAVQVVAERPTIFDFSPAVPGYPESAPAFDGLVKNVSAPRLAGCVSRMVEKRTVCQCYTEQGTRYNTSLPRCLAVVRGNEYQPRLATIYAANNGFVPTAPVLQEGE